MAKMSAINKNNKRIKLSDKFYKKRIEKCHQQDWEEGKKTAGSYASMVKNNLQLNRNNEVSKREKNIFSGKNPFFKYLSFLGFNLSLISILGFIWFNSAIEKVV